MSQSDFLKKRYTTYNDNKLMQIVTKDRHKYEELALETAESILNERGVKIDHSFNRANASRWAEIEDFKNTEGFGSLDDEIIHQLTGEENPDSFENANTVDFDLNSRSNAEIRPLHQANRRHQNYQTPRVQQEDDSLAGIKTFFHIILLVIQLGLLLVGLISMFK